MKKPQIILIIIASLAFLGFLDSTYLTILHYQNIIPPCTITSGCEKVLTSPYSQIGIIPVSLLGSLFFLTMTILSIFLLQSKTPTLKISFFNSHLSLQKALLILSVAGFLVSLGFFMIQLLVIKEFCPYCLFSETMSFLILTCSVVLIRVKSS